MTASDIIRDRVAGKKRTIDWFQLHTETNWCELSRHLNMKYRVKQTKSMRWHRKYDDGLPSMKKQIRLQCKPWSWFVLHLMRWMRVQVFFNANHRAHYSN